MQTIYLDVSNKGVTPRIYAKQSDVGRKFIAIISENGVPYNLAGDSVVSVWYEGKSGSGNYTEIGNSSAVSITDNKIIVELIEQMLSVPGNGVLTIVINSENGEQIGLWNIEYDVEPVAGWNSDEAKNYFSAFSKATENLFEASRVFYPDKTLTKSGSPADAEVTGEKISVLESRVSSIASLPEGSTTGDAEIVDARVGFDGTTYENLGDHIRDVGKFAHDELVGTMPISIIRSRQSNGGLANLYSTSMRIVGGEKYLTKLQVPVFIDRSGGYSGVHHSVIAVYNGRKSEQDPIASEWVEIPEDKSFVLATISVGEWFYTQDTIVVTVIDGDTDGILLYPVTSKSVENDWVEDDAGLVTFPDGTLNEDVDVRFVGVAEFQGTLREDVKRLFEKSVDDHGALALVDTAYDGVVMEARYEEFTPFLELIGSRGDEAVLLGGVATPKEASHAANKEYVDDAVAGAAKVDYYHTKRVPLSDATVTALQKATYAAIHKNYKNLLGLTDDEFALTALKDDNGNATELHEFVFSVGDYNTQETHFNPDEVHKPKFLILSGIHGGEKPAALATYRFFEDLMKGNNLPSYLREGAIFKVIPVANPSGFNKNGTGTRENANGVNLNRNFDYQWDEANADDVLNENIGSGPASELETQVITKWLKDNKDAVAFIDMHCGGMPGEYVGIIGAGTNPDVTKAKEIAMHALDKVIPYWKSCPEYTEDTTFCYSSNADVYKGKIINGPATYYASEKLGIPSLALECLSDGNFTITPESIAVGAEVLGNVLLELFKQARIERIDGWFEIADITTTAEEHALYVSTEIPCKEIVAQLILPGVLTGTLTEWVGVGPGQYDKPYGGANAPLDATYRTYRLSVVKGMFAEISGAYTTAENFWNNKGNLRILRSDDGSTKKYLKGFIVQRGGSTATDAYPIGTVLKVWGLKA